MALPTPKPLATVKARASPRDPASLKARASLKDPASHPEDKLREDRLSVNVKLVPFMVSACVHIRGGSETRNFSLANDDIDFINTTFNYMFEKAELVMRANTAAYLDLIQTNRAFIDKEALTEMFCEAVVREHPKVSIIGFNSAKFDTNMVFKRMVTNGRRIDCMFGSSSTHKQIIVSHTQTDVRLRFIDIRDYVAGGSLDEFTRNFGLTETRVKGFFPYEHVTLINWKEVLYLPEPFEQKHFHSTFTNSDISDTGRQVHRKASIPFQNGLDYMIHYCDGYVEAMIDLINSLIEILLEFDIDMLHNHSLSSNAAAIEYHYAYKDFDINDTYRIVFIEPADRIRITSQFFNRMLQRYILQDRRAKRDTTNNVNDGDHPYFMRMFMTKPCHLCGESLTWDNRRPSTGSTTALDTRWPTSGHAAFIVIRSDRTRILSSDV